MPSSPPAPVAPSYTVAMTVLNAGAWIPKALDAILGQLGPEGELIVVDAESTDGTTETIRSRAQKDPRVRLIVEKCSMGKGRDRGIQEARAPIVITQVDADVRYAPGVLGRGAQELARREGTGLLLVTGSKDLDPDGTKLFVWDRAFYRSTTGYPDANVADDILAIRGALARGRVGRLLVEHVGEDLRAAERSAEVVHDPWKKGPGFFRVSRRRFTQGWTLRQYLRFLWVTRRTLPRFVAGAVLAIVARLSPAA